MPVVAPEEDQPTAVTGRRLAATGRCLPLATGVCIVRTVSKRLFQDEEALSGRTRGHPIAQYENGCFFQNHGEALSHQGRTLEAWG